MSQENLMQQVMALPLAERIELAQALWESIGPAAIDSSGDERHAVVEEALRRDAELTSGSVAGQSHEEVMEEVRRILECD